MLKKNGGITLIALVITIIVLLILAGVSIAMLSGDNGILNRAGTASAKNELGAANDAVSLFVSDKVAEYYEKSYVTNEISGTDKTLDAYLVEQVTEANLATAIDNKDIPEGNIKVTSTATAVTKIEMTITNNKGTFKSTGTVTNGKISWVITNS